jgi:hypothetical protein
LQRVAKKLNDRPRKCLNYKTPHEVFSKSCERKGVALRILIGKAYQIADRKTGEIKNFFSETCWISSIATNTNNLHELINLCAKKPCLIENNFNTAKNRGCNYKHAYSYDWNAVQCFHRLMRLGHAINAITEFTKTIKKYIKDLGVRATLKIIKETLFAP